MFQTHQEDAARAAVLFSGYNHHLYAQSVIKRVHYCKITSSINWNRDVWLNNAFLTTSQVYTFTTKKTFFHIFRKNVAAPKITKQWLKILWSSFPGFAMIFWKFQHDSWHIAQVIKRWRAFVFFCTYCIMPQMRSIVNVFRSVFILCSSHW